MMLSMINMMYCFRVKGSMGGEACGSWSLGFVQKAFRPFRQSSMSLQVSSDFVRKTSSICARGGSDEESRKRILVPLIIDNGCG